MNAGRDLDALVAEKVMGIKLGEDCKGETGELPNSADGWFCWDCGAEGGWGDDGHEVEAKRYSTDIKAAWEVMERMRRFHPSIANPLPRPNPWDAFTLALWREFYPWGGDESDAWSSALFQLSPVRICHAALKALGVEVLA